VECGGALLHRFCFDDGYAFTAPVGSFKANAIGLKDMLGNVRQWCEDYYDDKFYQNGENKDPLNSKSGDRNRRVQRGCSWDSVPLGWKAADRGGAYPASSTSDVGFRVLALPLARTP
jgi:sulfatase modifying factor 1